MPRLGASLALARVHLLFSYSSSLSSALLSSILRPNPLPLGGGVGHAELMVCTNYGQVWSKSDGEGGEDNFVMLASFLVILSFLFLYLFWGL